MISSVEVGTLVTALGCGIGKEEFNPDKLRYHSIIIMTDADVDGSHIRTLLLTFFFRQMPQLIERGHIFIAQPPLYKIAKGKQHQYLKDDDALAQYLTQSALEDASLQVNTEAPPISGPALEQLVGEYRTVQSRIERLSRLYPKVALQQMVYLPQLSLTELADRQSVVDWTDQLAKRLSATVANDRGSRFEVTIEEDTERRLFLPAVHVIAHSVSTHYRLNHDFFNSGDYQQMVRLGNTLNGLIEKDGYVRRGERSQPVTAFSEALTWLMAQAERGHTIQRYKGLGEMNPEQLWETTMDASVRRMLQVKIEDAIAADQIFTCLMGDSVEPRREFIEQNALKVSNLDI
jgi:DNA gyrase subunit B